MDLDAIREAESKATPGPWEFSAPEFVWTPDGEGSILVARAMLGDDTPADAEFIAMARTAVPALLVALDEMTVARDRLAREAEAEGWAFDKAGWQEIADDFMAQRDAMESRLNEATAERDAAISLLVDVLADPFTHVKMAWQADAEDFLASVSGGEPEERP